MAKAAIPRWLLLLLALLLTAHALQGFTAAAKLPSASRKITPESWRRVMIGSTAPRCTYNECRECKYKCRAEQVPVEGNDPINSAYHYRCVCHR